jgi:hypothetical protein
LSAPRICSGSQGQVRVVLHAPLEIGHETPGGRENGLRRNASAIL